MAIAPNKLTPEEIEAKNEDSYEYLLSLIEDTQGQMALIIAACNSMAQRDRIIKRYEADAWEEEKVRPFRIRLGQEPSLRAARAALEEEHPYLKEEGRAVVSVTGAELLLRVKVRGDEAQTELEKFFGYLQWTREALRAFKYPVVLWVSREILREMSRRAPDFWSWRKAVLRFEEEATGQEPLFAQLNEDNARGFQSTVQGGTIHQAAQIQIGLEDNQDLPPLDVLLEEIAALEAREPESYGLATLYHKLGQVYAQQVRKGEATAAAEGQRAIEAFKAGIERYQAQGNWDAAATALNRLAGFYDGQSQFAEAARTAQAALDAARQASNPVEEMIALRRMGNAKESLSSFQQSIEHYQQSLDLAQAIPDRKGIAASLGSLGNAYNSLGDFQKAIAFYSQCLEITQEIGDQQGIAASLGNLGNTYFSLGDFQKAIAFYSQSLKIQQEIGNQQDIAAALEGLGIAYLSLGDYQKAIAFQSQSLEIKQEIGDQQGIANSLGNLGIAYRSLRDFQKAIAFYSQSLKIYQEIGDRQGEAASHFNLAQAQAKLDDAWSAKQNFEQAKAIFKSLKLDHKVEKCDTALYEINQIITKYPRRAPAIRDTAPTSPAFEASVSEKESKPIAPYLNLPIWAWFLIGLSIVVLLALLFS